MPCITISQKTICCVPDDLVNLEPFGAKVWCEVHRYFGPTFYRSAAATTQIRVPSKKTFDAFDAWRNSLQEDK
jgi:hypothetical protein